MAKLNTCKNYLTVVLHQEFLTFSFDTEQNCWIFQKVIECSKNVKKSSDVSIECCAFSPCGKYFGVCFDRNIIIYKTFDWSTVCVGLGERKASSLQFFPKSRVVLLADKSGCAAFYSFKEDTLEKTELALGHNSMLTGALITEDEKFVITSDRDEKIRVTNYPNVYNIERYCLGHKMFVSCIEFLPSDKNVLISGSGDGTVRLWNILTGKELAVYDLNKDNDQSDDEKKTITKIVLCKKEQISVVAVSVYKSSQITILNVKVNSNSFEIELAKILNLDYIPWDIAFYGDILVCLVPNKKDSLAFWSPTKDDVTEYKTYFKNVTQYLTDNWDSVLNTSTKITDNIPVLFKREMDNLQEYEQRKKARLLRTGKTS